MPNTPVTARPYATVGQFLQETTRRLTLAGIKTARLDSLVLIEYVLGCDRVRLLAYPEMKINHRELQDLKRYVARRVKHEPIAYIKHSAPFYGRSFFVDKNTLIPRPETENIIELLKEYSSADVIGKTKVHIADIGTGSGCLGITATLELGNVAADLYDVSQSAIEVARKNALLHKVTGAFYTEDLLSRASRRNYDIVMANLPYVPDKYPINQDATFEPTTALFAGPDGLRYYESLWAQIPRLRFRPTYVLTETMEAQHLHIAALARCSGYSLIEARGLIQLFQRIL